MKIDDPKTPFHDDEELEPADLEIEKKEEKDPIIEAHLKEA